MGARRGRGKGVLAPPPPGIRNNDALCCLPTKYPKMFARAMCTRNYIFKLGLHLKRLEKRKILRSRRKTGKLLDVVYSAIFVKS